MPKRIATPPPGDDEPKYLTVVQPWPPNGNWELQEDIVKFSRWIACVLGDPKPLFAFFWKPKSRGMVILEIDRTYPEYRRLLGEHRWKETLVNASAEETRVSQIFYCLHNSDREVQKDGWKRINVKDEWFNDWSIRNPLIQYPYPESHRCNVPSEDRTNKSLCRPLPVSLFPVAVVPVIKAPRAVVGSAGWVSGQRTAPPPAKAAWSQPKTKLKSATVNPRPGPAGGYGVRLAPASASASVWSTPSPSAAFVSNSPTTPSAWASSIASSVPGPPGLTRSAWASSVASSVPASPGLTRSAQSSVDTASSAGSTSFEDTMSNIQIYDEDDPDTEYAGSIVTHQDYGNGTSQWNNYTSTSTTENLWTEEHIPKPAVEEIKCLAHGKICRKGICKEYAAQLRKEEMAKRMASKPKSGAKNKGGRNKKQTLDDETASTSTYSGADEAGVVVAGRRGSKKDSTASSASVSVRDDEEEEEDKEEEEEDDDDDPWGDKAAAAAAAAPSVPAPGRAKKNPWKVAK